MPPPERATDRAAKPLRGVVIDPHAYRCHGWTIVSDRALAADRAPVHGKPAVGPHDGPEPDLVIETVGVEPVPDVATGDAAVLAERHGPDSRFYVFTRAANGTVCLQFPDYCRFNIDASLSRVRCTLDPKADASFVDVLTNGLLLSSLLMLRGHPVLHASAAEVDGGALAFIGASGMGKSTLTAMLAADGHPIITDDVLRIDSGAGGQHCRLGATEVRLRAGAEYLAESFDTRGRRTSDDRLAVPLPRSRQDRLPLRALVVPLVDRSATEVDIQVVPGLEALPLLIAFPRILGWKDPGTTREHFAHLAGLIRDIPVLRARIPWGPPHDPDLAARVTSACRAAIEAHPARLLVG